MNRYWAGTPNYSSGNDGIQFLFPHWTCGGFDGSVATLQNPAREASANYVIGDDNVAQLVNEGDTSWHCGNYWYNRRSISYEMVGWPGCPPTTATLNSTAQLMAEASQAYFGGAALVLGENVMLHKMVYATACPGESDINYLIAKANELLGAGVAPSPSPQPEPAPEGGSGFEGGCYVVNADVLNIRDRPDLGGAVVGSYGRGETVILDSWYTTCDGYVWGRYTSFGGDTRYVAVGPNTGVPDNNDFLLLGGAPTPPYTPEQSSIDVRTYTVVADVLNVRDAPSGNVVGSYTAGETVNLDGSAVDQGGYLWGSYMSYSGNTRYVAVGTSDGSESYLV